MSKRPAIPAELRRRILVEAGHRCAIHTCRHPDIDVHHIIPWEICREHAYDNLIALCPNCHRRADSGEIDRKSLRLYKAQLAASFGIEQSGGKSSSQSERSQATQPWNTHLIQDTRDAYPPYEVEIEFPQFHPDEGDSIEELNILQRAAALRKLHEFRDVSDVIKYIGNQVRLYRSLSALTC